MILFLLILGALPGMVAFAIYPQLTSRRLAWLIAFGAAAVMAALLAVTVQFWWLGERTEMAVAASSLVVSILIGFVAGILLIAAFVGLFGGPDPATPRPLHRVIATGVTTVTSLLLCPALIDIQRGLG
ncbi:MAG: hypothetical protein AAGA70_03935 [Pseudomonadota bacterium]